MSGLSIDDLKGSLESKITELEANIEKERAEAKRQAARAENEQKAAKIREQAETRIGEALDLLNSLKQKMSS